MIFEMPTCGGCRTCEMACSFRHKGEFIPSVSSIKIIEKKGEPGYVVSIAEIHDGETMACDCFAKQHTPLCIEHCIKSKDLGQIFKDFIEKKTPKDPIED